MTNSKTNGASVIPGWLCEEVLTPSGLSLPYFLTQLNTMWPDLEERLGIHANNEEGVLNTIAFWENPLRQGSPDLDWPSLNSFPLVCYEPDPGVIQDAVLPITKGMVAAKRVRRD